MACCTQAGHTSRPRETPSPVCWSSYRLGTHRTLEQYSYKWYSRECSRPVASDEDRYDEETHPGQPHLVTVAHERDCPQTHLPGLQSACPGRRAGHLSQFAVDGRVEGGEGEEGDEAVQDEVEVDQVDPVVLRIAPQRRADHHQELAEHGGIAQCTYYTLAQSAHFTSVLKLFRAFLSNICFFALSQSQGKLFIGKRTFSKDINMYVLC